jgi:D-proline reductase (dithiol) PrdB
MNDQALTDAALGFAPPHDQPVPYLERIRDYYVTLGFGTPYRWAQYAEVPFQPLKKPLDESTLAIVTTAAPYQPDKGDQGPGAPYNASAKFYRVYDGSTAGDPDLRISHIGYDRQHTTATDQNAWFPLPALRRAVAAKRIGRLATRFYGAPTNRSQSTTLEVDCPEILARCRDDAVDCALLIAT